MSDPRPPSLATLYATTTASAVIDTITVLRQERDQAIGAVLLLAYQEVISFDRARELLGWDLMRLRYELRRAMGAA